MHTLREFGKESFRPGYRIPLTPGRYSVSLHFVEYWLDFRVVDVLIEVPEEWTLSAIPASLESVDGLWGTVGQTVEVNGRTIRLRRDVAINADVLTPGDFGRLRGAINDLRATRSLLLALVPVSGHD